MHECASVLQSAQRLSRLPHTNRILVRKEDVVADLPGHLLELARELHWDEHLVRRQLPSVLDMLAEHKYAHRSRTDAFVPNISEKEALMWVHANPARASAQEGEEMQQDVCVQAYQQFGYYHPLVQAQ